MIVAIKTSNHANLDLISRLLTTFDLAEKIVIPECGTQSVVDTRALVLGDAERFGKKRETWKGKDFSE